MTLRERTRRSLPSSPEGPIAVRPAARSELPLLVAHLPESAGTSHADELAAHARGAVTLLVAWQGEEPVGRLRIRWAGPEGIALGAARSRVPELFGLEVVRLRRRRGVGTALLRCAEAQVRARGGAALGLAVALDNGAARRMYARAGFRDAALGVFAHETSYTLSARPLQVREPCEFWIKELSTPMLVLFDIDGTLLTSQGAGRAAMESAGKSLFGEAFAFGDVAVNGRLDPLIWHDLARSHGLDPTPELEQTFREQYLDHLTRRLERPGVVEPLPGVRTLVERLRERAGTTLGILSGNYPETGRLKLRAGGFDPADFVVCAWGDDAPSRPDLVDVARRRYAEHLPGTDPAELPSSAILVIGDTPHDVECARVNGCRSLAVATGASSREELASAGAHHAVDDLAEVDTLLRWIHPS